MQITKLLTDIARFFTFKTSVKPASQDEYQAFIKNLHAVVNCLVDGLWQPNTEYALNHILRTPNMPRGYIAKVVQAGVSDANEPDWGDGKANVTDGTVQWKLIKEVPTVNGTEADTEGNFTISPLIAYPVGSIYMSTVSTSPETLFGGKWEKMPAGRVLLPEGTSEWGTTYAAGSTGGEATHKLTVGELPSHNHSASSANAGGHAHDISSTYCVLTTASGGVIGHGSGNTRNTKTGSGVINSNGSHSHTVTVGNTGSGQAHNNMVPYITVYCWKRVS